MILWGRKKSSHTAGDQRMTGHSCPGDGTDQTLLVHRWTIKILLCTWTCTSGTALYRSGSNRVTTTSNIPDILCVSVFLWGHMCLQLFSPSSPAFLFIFYFLHLIDLFYSEEEAPLQTVWNQNQTCVSARSHASQRAPWRSLTATN